MIGEHVAEGTRQPVEFQYREHVPFAKSIEEAVEFRPLPSSPRSLLAINTLTPGRLQRRPLRNGLQIVG